MSANLLRNWFVPGDGITRQVISADIQKYLGNDATIRPGKTEVNGKEVDGYWIKAYRNLTTEMINDLRIASQTWEQEQRSGRRGVKYEDSHTYRTSATLHNGGGTNSPQLDGPYLPPAQARPGPPDMPGYPDPRAMYPPHPVTSGYVDPSIYAAQNGGRQPPPNYGQQAEYYGQNPAYAHEPVRTHPGGSPQYPGQFSVGQYGQPQPRDPREDPRYHQEFQDPPPRYAAYPPASTAPNGQQIYSPSQPSSNYGPPPIRSEAPYGRPYSQAPSIPDPAAYRPPSAVESPYHPRDRPSGPPGGDARRRRIQ